MFYLLWLLKNKQTIDNIATEQFNELKERMINDGWRLVRDYGGLDKGIDYDFCALKRKNHRVVLEWSNYDEGSIKAPAETIALIRDTYLEI